MSQAAADNRRIADRIPHTVEVSVSSEHNFYTGFSENISEGGLFIATHMLEPIGTILEFRFALGHGKMPVTVRGVVRWVRGENEDIRIAAGMGLQFIDLHPKVEAAIDNFIQNAREALFFDED